MEPTSKARKSVLGTYLESVAEADVSNQSQTSAQEAPRPAPPPPNPAAGAAEPPTLSTVLRFLVSVEPGREVTITDVAAGLMASTVATADVVQRMAYGGLVTVDGDPGREFIHLTEQGRGLTTVA